MTTEKDLFRCPWCKGSELYKQYHDQEWGVAVHDDQKLFEMLILEGAQAGLSWLTILKRREGYREAFHGFVPEIVAEMSSAEQEALLENPKIIRNRLKIKSTIENGKAFLKIQAEFGSFSTYLWGFVAGQPILNRFEALSEVPVATALSDTISRDLKKRGFKFVGSTIIYAYLQAVGVVNDHLVDCHRYTDGESVRNPTKR